MMTLAEGRLAERKEVVPVAVSTWREINTASAVPTAPAAKATDPTTTALAARTRPRRGLAAKVVAMRPRRYSEVTNKVGQHDKDEEAGHPTDEDAGALRRPRRCRPQPAVRCPQTR